MRFKAPASFIVLLCSAIYVIQLGVNNKLDLYIHPRYIVFTLFFGLVCFGLVGVNFVLNGAVNAKILSKQNLPLLIILFGGLLLPAQSLSSATVTQRSIDGITATTNPTTSSELFSQSSRALSIQDWSRLLAANQNPDFYANKNVEISGFIYDANQGPNIVQLSRFVVTCCAVDAQPIGIPVLLEGWNNAYQEDQWLQVEGVFERQETANGELIVLVPDNVKEIEEPDNPYAN